MKIITYEDIKNLNPCEDPIQYIPKTWEGTVLDILNLEQVPGRDRLWVVLKKDFLEGIDKKRFVLKCAREIQYLMKDERSSKALDVAEAYLEGRATKEELEVAEKAANVAYATAYFAAYAANVAYAAARNTDATVAANVVYAAAYASTCDAAYAANVAYAAACATVHDNYADVTPFSAAYSTATEYTACDAANAAIRNTYVANAAAYASSNTSVTDAREFFTCRQIEILKAIIENGFYEP